VIDNLAQSILAPVAQLLLSPGSLMSIWSLFCALMIAVVVALVARRGRPVSLRATIRAMFPRHRLFGTSARADLCFTMLSTFASSALFGWAVLSHLAIASGVMHVLGKPFLLGLPSGLAVAAMTLAMWLAYEFAYWFDHLLSHKIPALWAFHKVHHSAETLSPLTIFRVHPVDSIVFYNIVAVITGVTAGVMHWLVGPQVSPLTLAGTNVVMIAAIFTIKHLHHSHVWISWRGSWGRLILSPAHHQIHHSAAVEHHDRNFGGTLAIFDWLAGTLHQPAPKREPLRFGVKDLRDPHSIHGSLFAPFADALSLLWARKAAGGETTPETQPSSPDIRPATH
jgi:sterol desaturase/sphingolipid hydroxylase (fatty acid hydroxylase superfamily)